MDVTFGDYLRALITADTDLVMDDDLNYRVAIVEAFRRRGIYPRDCRSLAVDSLLWEPLAADMEIGWLSELDLDHKESREDIWKQAERNTIALRGWLDQQSAPSHELFRQMGLWLREDAPKTIRRSRKTKKPAVEVHSVRPTRRIGPDGEDLPQLVIEITQSRRGFSDDAQQRDADENGRTSRGANFMFRGGCTLIVDLHSRRVRYVIGKDIASDERLRAQRKFLFEGESESLGATYFGIDQVREPFAFLHRNG